MRLYSLEHTTDHCYSCSCEDIKVQWLHFLLLHTICVSRKWAGRAHCSITESCGDNKSFQKTRRLLLVGYSLVGPLSLIYQEQSQLEAFGRFDFSRRCISVRQSVTSAMTSCSIRLAKFLVAFSSSHSEYSVVACVR